MVQKSGKLTCWGLVFEIPLFTTGFRNTQTVVGLGISEPSRVSKVEVRFFEVRTFTYVTDWQKRLQQSGVLFE